MDILSHLADGFIVATQWNNLILVILGCFCGTLIGMLPGIGPINAIAILFPITFSMGLEATSAIIMFAGIYYGSQYGNSISSILLNVPGTSAAAVTVLDGYPMAKSGKAGPALAMSAVASFVGGVLSIFWLILFAPILADFAIDFGPAEYFVLMIFAFSALSGLTGDNPIKSLIAALFGLGISMIGIDPQSGVARYTFGSMHLLDGLDFIVVTIGLFAVSEVISMLIDEVTPHTEVISRNPISRVMISLKEFTGSFFTMVRSNVVGFITGVLPGAGGTIASFICYGMEKKIHDKDSKTFGKGDIRGVAAPESANNSAATGSFIPLLILGVPGSETTAVMLGALTSFGVNPGPMLLSQSPDIFWGLAASMFIGNIVLIILNLPLVGIFIKILSIPKKVLMPLVLLLSVIGVYSVSNNGFDVLIMAVFGVIGYVMKQNKFPLAPVILGLVLGDLIEKNLRRAMIYSDGSIGIFFENAIVNTLWILTILSLLMPIIMKKFSIRLRLGKKR